jgi:hypothetical protein
MVDETCALYENLTIDYMVDRMMQVMAYIIAGKDSNVILKVDVREYKIQEFEKFKNTMKNHWIYFQTLNNKNELVSTKVTFKEVILEYQIYIRKKKFDNIPYITLLDEDGTKLPYNIETKQDELNLFTGYNSSALRKGYDKEEFNLITKHMKEVYCPDNPHVETYVENLLGWTVQNPTRKPEIAIVMIGDQGCGKSNVIKEISNCVFGRRYTLELNKMEDITSKFNSLLEGKKVIIGDEVKGFGKDTAVLKNLICSGDMKIEHKGVNPFVIKDTSIFFFISNDENYFKVEDHDRRYLVLRCSNKYCRDGNYFSALFKQLSNKSCGDNYYTYLATKDLSRFDRIRDLPMTETKQMMIEVSQDPCISFIQSPIIGKFCELATRINKSIMVGQNNVPCYSYLISKSRFDGFVQIQNLYLIYKEWHKENYTKRVKESLALFSQKISPHCEKKKNSTMYYRPKTWIDLDFVKELNKYNDENNIEYED